MEPPDSRSSSSKNNRSCNCIITLNIILLLKQLFLADPNHNQSKHKESRQSVLQCIRCPLCRSCSNDRRTIRKRHLGRRTERGDGAASHGRSMRMPAARQTRPFPSNDHVNEARASPTATAITNTILDSNSTGPKLCDQSQAEQKSR